MKKFTKTWLTIGMSLIVIGCVLFLILMTIIKWDFTKLANTKFETNTYEINEMFNDMSIETETANIEFKLSSDENCKVICYEEEKAKHIVKVVEEVLIIKIDNKKTWFDYLKVEFDSPKITIYLSKAEYDKLSIKEKTGNIEIPNNINFTDADINLSTGDVNFCADIKDTLKIKTTTGEINIDSISTGLVDISVSTGRVTVSNLVCENEFIVKTSTGKIHLKNIICKKVISTGKTGDILLENVVASDSFSIERSTGNIKFESCDANTLDVKTKTGNVSGSLLSNKVFIVTTNTGKVNVPKTIDGGKCEISTSTGNIDITIS